MKHIKQTMNMACWYASAQMLVQWKKNFTQSTPAKLLDPSQDFTSRKLWEVNNGITNPEIMLLAKRLGLREISPLSPTSGALKSWLIQYGPLWVNGTSHIVVIAGIRNEDGRHAEVLVYDPWYYSLEAKSVEWRSLSTWYAAKQASSRDTSSSVQAVFLYCP